MAQAAFAWAEQLGLSEPVLSKQAKNCLKKIALAAVFADEMMRVIDEMQLNARARFLMWLHIVIYGCNNGMGMQHLKPVCSQSLFKEPVFLDRAWIPYW